MTNLSRPHHLPLYFSLSFLACFSSCLAEVSEENLSQLEGFATKAKSALKTLESFEMSGILRITISDEYLQYNPGPKVSQKKFRILAKGDKIKETVESLDSSGNTISTTVYFLDSKRIVEVSDSNGVAAKIFTLGTKDNLGLFNFCPAFLEYSFLGLSIARSGIPALSISDLASDQKWAALLKNALTVETKKDGAMTAVFSGPKGSSSITLLRSSDSESGYRIGSVSFFDKNNAIDRKIEVIDVFSDALLGDFGKSFKVGVYRLNSEAPSITWEFLIDNIRINPPIGDESFDFDPTSVEQIFDGDSDTFIEVPR